MSEPRTLSAPIGVDLMITRRCNLTCLHCSASADQFEGDDLTTKDLLTLVAELSRHKVLRLALTGGEPLLHPDFFTIASAVIDHRMALQINTNATLVSPEIVDKLASLRRRPFISVSVDGVTAGTHDRIRGAGSFERVMSGVRLLTAAGLRVRPFVVVSRLNYHELPAIVDFCASLGVAEVFLSTPVSTGRALCYSDEMALGADAMRDLLEGTLEVLRKTPTLLRGPWVDMAKLYDDLKHGRALSKSTERIFTNCGGGRTQLAIACDGTVAPCQMAFRYRAGNIRTTPFGDVWRHSPVLAHVRQCQGRPLDSIHGCEGCRWQSACAGPCPATGVNMTGRWPSAGTLCLKDVAAAACCD